jgi:beta-glucosidase
LRHSPNKISGAKKLTDNRTPRPNTPSHSLKTFRALLFSLALIPCLAIPVFAQDSAVPVVTGVPRVDKLLSQMTLEEKMALIRGASEDPTTNQGQAGYLTGVPRLGIPPIRMSDGPPGVLTRNPSMAETATMGLAATFSAKDAEQNGEVVAREAKSLGIDVVLEPFINIDRDITFARGYNTEGEDPVLTGIIGANFIRGVQGQGVMSQAKHYVAYDTDGANVYVDQQALHEIYVAPFIDAVQAGVSSIMCSYNKVNGVQACGNPDTLVKILRDEVGFKGFVTSDWGAVHAADYINKGLDMEMPGPSPKGSPFESMMFSFFTTEEPHPAPPLKFNDAMLAGFLGGTLPEEPKPKPFAMGTIGSMRDPRTNLWSLRKEGKLDDATITRAAGRVLYEIDKFGYLDHPTPGQAGPKNPPVHAIEENANAIQKTAEDAAVLLKNEDGILPLKSSDTVALIGPGAGQTISIGTAGERSIGWPWRQIGTVQAIAKIDPSTHITYAVEDDMTGAPIPAEVWSKPGLERIGKDGAKSTDAVLDFTTKAGTALPANTAATWTGTLNIPTSGYYWIYLQLLGAAGSIEMDGKRIAGANGMRGGVHGDTVLGGKDGLMPTTDGLDNLRTAVDLTAGAHTVKVSIEGDTSNHPAQVRLAWVTPEERKKDHEAAIEAAKSAQTAVVFAWSRGKQDFVLPGNGLTGEAAYDQDKLIEEIAAVNPNTVVVLNISQPIAMPWLSKVKGVLQMWWPGDEGGWATAKILLGKTSPAGRLPFTWAKKLTDYAANDPRFPERSAKGVNGKTTFSEGINVGYRWFDKEKIQPQFPFGFGLSYTTFAYSNLKTEPAAEGGIVVEFDVKNTGPVASDEVPQIYLGRPEHKFPGQFPEHALVAFDRIHLNPGESKRVSITVPLRRLQFWNTEAGKWTTATGPRAVLVGSSSRSLDLASSINIP